MTTNVFEEMANVFNTDFTKDRIVSVYNELLTGEPVTLHAFANGGNTWNTFNLQRTESVLKSDHGKEHEKKIVQYFFYSPFDNSETGEYRYESMYIVRNNNNDFDEFYEWFTDEVAYSGELWCEENMYIFGDHEVQDGVFGEFIRYLEQISKVTAE